MPLTIQRQHPVEGESDFDVNPEAEDDDVIFFPIIPGEFQLRFIWYMRRRRRPMVPAPNYTPMPDKFAGEEKARLFALSE